MKKGIIKGIVTSSAFTTFMVAGTVIGQHLRTKRYSVEVEGFNSGVSIVAISDFHNIKSKIRLNSILNHARNASPDLIFLLGDINTTPLISKYYDIIGKLTQVAPVYFVRGNHDNDYNNYLLFKDALQNLGVKVLENESELIEVNGAKLNLIGITDCDIRGVELRKTKLKEYIKQADEKIAELYNGDYINLVLAHRPNYILRSLKLPNIIGFSGHTHGGQFRIPFTNYGVFTPNQGLFSKYSYGAIVNESSILLISSGVGNHGSLPRLYNPREIVHLEIN